MRKDLFYKGRISPDEKQELVNNFFFAGYDSYTLTKNSPNRFVGAACSESRPTHRAYTMPAGEFRITSSGDYSFYLTNVQEPSLKGDHSILAKIILDKFPIKKKAK
jgi:hypothetical protein